MSTDVLLEHALHISTVIGAAGVAGVLRAAAAAADTVIHTYAFSTVTAHCQQAYP
jgi:hypothetical protein